MSENLIPPNSEIIAEALNKVEEAREEGRQQGQEEGYDAGYSEGLQEGYGQGENETKNEIFMSFAEKWDEYLDKVTFEWNRTHDAPFPKALEEAFSEAIDILAALTGNEP